MKTGFKIALATLAFVVGAGLGQAQTYIRMANAEARLAQEQSDEARLAQEQSDKDAKNAQACRDVGGMPIYSFTWRLAGCYQPLPKK
jgi:hypothetical protein